MLGWKKFAANLHCMHRTVALTDGREQQMKAKFGVSFAVSTD